MPTIAYPCNWNQSQLIYESLLRFNLLDGSLQPGLGKELQETDATTFVVALQDGTKWSDGSELTAADVVFTFELGKDNSTYFSDVWTVHRLGHRAGPAQRAVQAQDQAAQPRLGQELHRQHADHAARRSGARSIRSKLAAEPNLQPVGSGPFKLDKADQTQVNLKRDDDYWGKAVYGTPAMTTINHPIFKTNNDANLKLESGETRREPDLLPADLEAVGGQEQARRHLAQGEALLPARQPTESHPNLTVKGLDNVKVRQAIAYAIDYPSIAATAMSDYSVPANASLILPSGFESKYYDAAAVDAEGWKYDKAKAISILEDELKAEKGSDGIYVLPDGTKLGGWKLITPTGWTDWNTACEIVAKSAKAVGIGITTEFPQAPTMQTAMFNGDFELVMYNYTAVNPASPWTRFRDAMDDRGVPEVGKRAFYNYNRFSDPEVPALLDAAAARQERRRGQDGLRRPGQDLPGEDPGRPADVPADGLLPVQPDQLGELPHRGEPVRPADVAGCGHPVVLQDQASGHLDPD